MFSLPQLGTTLLKEIEQGCIIKRQRHDWIKGFEISADSRASTSAPMTKPHSPSVSHKVCHARTHSCVQNINMADFKTSSKLNIVFSHKSAAFVKEKTVSVFV